MWILSYRMLLSSSKIHNISHLSFPPSSSAHSIYCVVREDARQLGVAAKQDVDSERIKVQVTRFLCDSCLRFSDVVSRIARLFVAPKVATPNIPSIIECDSKSLAIAILSAIFWENTSTLWFGW